MEVNWRPFVYGGLASCIAECGTFPLDLAKTRLQVQGQQKHSGLVNVQYRGMIHVLTKTASDQGIRALYSGISPALLRQCVYGTLKFGMYYSLRNAMENKFNERDNVTINIFCATLSGMVASAIANPTDVLKVRLQSHINETSARNTFLLFKDIYIQEGMKGLWRGVWPTAQRAGVIAAFELPLYDFCKYRLIPYIGDTVQNHFISSIVASIGSSIASTPIDVIRTRLMNEKYKKIRRENAIQINIYKGSMDCLIQTIKFEGVMALYKGFFPIWLRMGPWNIIFFTTYEKLRNIY